MTLPPRTPDPATLSAALGEVPLFRLLPDDDLETLASACRIRRFRRGEVIFHQGDPGDALHVIAGRPGEDLQPVGLRRGGDPRRRSGRASSSGRSRCIDGEPRSATATAVEPSETMVLPRERFRQLVNERVEVRDIVFAELARELRRLTNHVEELHFLDIAGRLASLLVADGGGAGGGRGRRPSPTEIRLDGPITQGELAAMVGSTRQSVNKLLGYFTDDGLIRDGPRRRSWSWTCPGSSGPRAARSPGRPERTPAAPRPRRWPRDPRPGRRAGTRGAPPRSCRPASRSRRPPGGRSRGRSPPARSRRRRPPPRGRRAAAAAHAIAIGGRVPSGRRRGFAAVDPGEPPTPSTAREQPDERAVRAALRRRERPAARRERLVDRLRPGRRRRAPRRGRRATP